MGTNKLIIAAAGSGKTTFLVKEALKITDKRILITTFTEANEREIKKKIVEINKCIPENITVQTWFSFLIQHGVKPFQGSLFDREIKGLLLVNGQSGIKYRTKYGPVFFSEKTEFARHYFSKDFKIYSDKLAKFVFRSNEKSSGSVIDRLCRIYPNIFIDEVQDLAGYDLEILKLLFASFANILLVGDPRQGTYSSNDATKGKQFRKGNIVHFFEDTTFQINTDTKSLTTNWRCTSSICQISNNLFPDLPHTNSGNTNTTGHDGVFFVKPKDVESYLAKYNPIQLRYDSRTEIIKEYAVHTYGDSKGLQFDRVLIYPTEPVEKWLLDNTSHLAETSRAKFYVAITRARFSAAVIYDFGKEQITQGITNYSDNEKIMEI